MEFRQVQYSTDLPIIIEQARIAHLESRLSYIEFSPEKVEKSLLRALAQPDRYAIFIAERKGAPVGFASVSVGEYHIGTDALLATIHNLSVIRSVREGLSGGRAAIGLMRGAKLVCGAERVRDITARNLRRRACPRPQIRQAHGI